MKDRSTVYDFDHTIIGGRVERARCDIYFNGVDFNIIIVPGNAAGDGWDIVKIRADVCGDGRDRPPEAIEGGNGIQLQILQDEKVELGCVCQYDMTGEQSAG